MKPFWYSSLLVFVFLTVALAQQKKAEKPQPSTRPKTPTVNCSDVQTSKACGSFKQLLEATDKDVLTLLSLPTSYVCFRPSEDAFLLFHVDEPTQYMWETLEGDAKGQTQYGVPVLAEFRNGVLYRTTNGIGYWSRSTRVPNSLPSSQMRYSPESRRMCACRRDTVALASSPPSSKTTSLRRTTRCSVSVNSAILPRFVSAFPSGYSTWPVFPFTTINRPAPRAAWAATFEASTENSMVKLFSPVSDVFTSTPKPRGTSHSALSRADRRRKGRNPGT